MCSSEHEVTPKCLPRVPSALAISSDKWQRRIIAQQDIRSGPMKDMRAHLDKLRKDAAECKLISDLATDRSKRELFEKLAMHYEALATEVERAIADQSQRTAT